MSNQVISLTGCDGCPLNDATFPGGEIYFVCCHPRRQVPRIKASLTELFENCPLKQHSLNIQIEQDGKEKD